MRPRAANLAYHAGTFSTTAGNSCRGFVAAASYPLPHARFDAVANELSLSAGFGVHYSHHRQRPVGRRWLRDNLRSRLKAKRSAP
jgi:hypothetical protein